MGSREKRLLFVVTEDWFFVSHFLGLARAARDAGYVIGVAARFTKHRALLEAEGFRLFALNGDRGSLSIVTALREIWAIYAAIRQFRPHLLHLIAMRAIALGGLIGMICPRLNVVVAPTGLGFLFTSRTRIARLARSLLKRLVRFYHWTKRGHLVFENAEDPLRFKLEPESRKVTLLGGAGVDTALFPAQPMPPSPPVKLALVARMLKSKGVMPSIRAVLAARSEGAPVELHLYGDVDPANPRSETREALHTWSQVPGIFWHGHVSDVPAIWRDHHIAILLSDREGMPRSLAEAAATARPIIATDVTGCREIVRDGETGFLVPPGDEPAVVVAIKRLVGDADLRMRMGEAGRAHFETRFTLQAVSAAMLDVYARLLEPPHHG